MMDGDPVANDDSYSILHDHTLSISASSGVLANDTADNPLTAAVVSNPTHGSLTLGSDGSISYMPTAGYAGSDAFRRAAAAR